MTDDNTSEFRKVRGNDINPATVGGRDPVESVDTGVLGRGQGDLMSVGSVWSSLPTFVPMTDPDDVSSTTFSAIVGGDDYIGAIPSRRIPDGASLYANHIVRPQSVPSGETGTYQIRILETVEGGIQSATPVLEVDVTESDNDYIVSSGWQELTAFNLNNSIALQPFALRAKVTGGTMSSRERRGFAVLFEWRVD